MRWGALSVEPRRSLLRGVISQVFLYLAVAAQVEIDSER